MNNFFLSCVQQFKFPNSNFKNSHQFNISHTATVALQTTTRSPLTPTQKAIADSVYKLFNGSTDRNSSEAALTSQLTNLGLTTTKVDAFLAALSALSSVLSPSPTPDQIAAFSQKNVDFGNAGALIIVSQPGLENFPNSLDMLEPLNQQFLQLLNKLRSARQFLTATNASEFFTNAAPEQYAMFISMLKDVSDLAVSKQGNLTTSGQTTSTTSGQTTTTTSGQATTTISAGKRKSFSVLRTLSNEFFIPGVLNLNQKSQSFFSVYKLYSYLFHLFLIIFQIFY